MERRSIPRFDLNTTILVSVIGGAGSLAAAVENISDRGVLIAVGVPLTVGDAVQVDSGDDLLVAEVRHCSRRNGQYVVGLSFADWVNKGTLQSFLRSFDGVEVAFT
jgi:hypothetical protein